MEILVSIGLLLIAAVIGFGFWWIQRKIERRERTRDAFSFRLMENSLASLEIGKATAEAVRDGHCNGNVSHALERVETAKRDTEEFLIAQMSENQRIA